MFLGFSFININILFTSHRDLSPTWGSYRCIQLKDSCVHLWFGQSVRESFMSHFRRHSELQSSLNVNQKIYFQITWRSVMRFETSKRPLPLRAEWAGWSSLCKMYLRWLNYFFNLYWTLKTKCMRRNLELTEKSSLCDWIVYKWHTYIHVYGVCLCFNSFGPQHQFWFHYSWLLLSEKFLNYEFLSVLRKSPARVRMRCKH